MTDTKNRRIVALLLSLVMMIAACSVSMFAFAVDEELQDPTLDTDEFNPSLVESIESLDIKSYMHFGDSMSTGYMLGVAPEDVATTDPMTLTHDETSALGPYTYGSYPSLIAEELGLESNQWYSFAREGLSTNDIHRIMDPSYYYQMDDKARRNSDQAFTLLSTFDELERMQTRCAQMLPNADLITIGAGPNDIIIMPLMDLIFTLVDGIQGNTLYSGIMQQAASAAMTYLQAFNVAAAYDEVLTAAGAVGALPEAMAGVGVSLARGYMYLQQNFEAMVNQIRSVNKDAIIVVLGGYNATRDLQFANVDMYRIGRNMGIFTTVMNLYWANTCPLRNEYYFVDIRNVDLPTWPYMMDWPSLLMGGGFMGYFMYCSHPSALGHQQIAEAVMNTLYQEDGTNTLPVSSLL